jgi:hypothetical protein
MERAKARDVRFQFANPISLDELDTRNTSSVATTSFPQRSYGIVFSSQ